MKYIIVIGCGRTGKTLATQLSVSENVVAIDKDLAAIEDLGDHFNGKKVCADALDITVLEQAGIKEADTLFLLTGNDNLNLVIGKVVKRLYNVGNVVLQVHDPDKKKTFQKEGLTIVSRNYLIAEVLKKCIS
ncbi:MAG: NAD-binding protein [Candidatus Omnitrophica bacterium]|nr:NAD-binding protein [Candidatus Omnitrophota bacterium]